MAGLVAAAEAAARGARVVVHEKGDRPGGLKVRFKRFGAATKAFIERAVQAQSQPAAAS